MPDSQWSPLTWSTRLQRFHGRAPTRGGRCSSTRPLLYSKLESSARPWVSRSWSSSARRRCAYWCRPTTIPRTVSAFPWRWRRACGRRSRALRSLLDGPRRADPGNHRSSRRWVMAPPRRPGCCWRGWQRCGRRVRGAADERGRWRGAGSAAGSYGAGGEARALGCGAGPLLSLTPGGSAAAPAGYWGKTGSRPAPRCRAQSPPGRRGSPSSPRE